MSYTSDRLRTAIEQGERLPEETDEEGHKPKKVQSIKSMRARKPALKMRPPTQLDKSADTQSPSQGEGCVVPEHLSYDADLATGIKALKAKAETTISDPGIRAKVMKSIKDLEDASSRVVPRGRLKVGKKQAVDQVQAGNIVQGKRKRVQFNCPVDKPPKKKVKETKRKSNALRRSLFCSARI